MLGPLSNLKQLLHPYFLVNLTLSVSYLLCKFLQPVCNLLFSGNCELDMREGEILFFLLVIIMVRARKHGSMTLVAYLNNSFIYCKVANSVLWFLAWKPYGFIFGFFFLCKGGYSELLFTIFLQKPFPLDENE